MFLISLGILLQHSEKIAFLVVAMIIVIGIIYSIRSGNRTAHEDELVKLLNDTTSRISSLIDDAQDIGSLRKDKAHDLQSEQIRDELFSLSNMLSNVRNSSRFKRLDRAEEISNKIASAVEKIDSVRRNGDTEKFYNAFQGDGNIILDVYRIVKDLNYAGNWFRAR